MPLDKLHRDPSDATSQDHSVGDNLSSVRMQNLSPQKSTEQAYGASGQAASKFLPHAQISETGIHFDFPDAPKNQSGKDKTPSGKDETSSGAPGCSGAPELPGTSQRFEKPLNHDGKALGLPHAPTPEELDTKNVQQGSVGDCFFEASLASLANTQKGRDSIAKMVQVNKDGSSTVTFSGDRSHPITITNDEIKKLTEEGNINDTSKVMQTVEAAFQKYNRVGAYGDGVNSLQNEKVPYLAQIRDPGSALHLLTGERTANEVIGALDSNMNLGGANAANVSRLLQNALSKGEPVVAGTRPGAEEPIINKHAYSVLGFDPKTNTVTVRNPWGDNPKGGINNIGDSKLGVTNAGEGKLTMSLETFMKNYDSVSMAGTNPTEMRMDDVANDAARTAHGIGQTFDDAFKGNFKQAFLDEANVFGNVFSTAKDATTAEINEAESVIGARVRGLYDTISEPFHGNLPSLQELNDGLGVPQPILDAASHAASSLASTARDIWNDIF